MTYGHRIRQFVSYLSQKSGTDMVYIVRNGIWLYGLQVFGAFSGLIISIFLTRYLTIDDFGSYRMFLSILAVFAIFTLPGMNVSIVRNVATGKLIDFAKIVKVKIRWSLLGSVLAWGTALYYLQAGNSEIALAFLIIAISLPWQESFFLFSPYLKGLKKFKESSLRLLVTRAIQAIAVTATVFLTSNWIWTLVALILSKILMDIVWYSMTFTGKRRVNKSDTTETVIYGKKLTLSNAIILLANQIDKLVLWHYTSAATLAYYSIALLVPNSLVGFSNLIPQLALPKFSKRNWCDRQEQKLLLLKLSKAGAVLFFFYLIYLLLIPIFIKLAFPDYVFAIPAAYLTGLIIILAPIQNILKQVFYANQNARYVYQISWFELLVLIALMMIYFGLGNNSLILFALLLPIKQLLGIGCSLWFMRFRLVPKSKWK